MGQTASKPNSIADDYGQTLFSMTTSQGRHPLLQHVTLDTLQAFAKANGDWSISAIRELFFRRCNKSIKAQKRWVALTRPRLKILMRANSVLKQRWLTLFHHIEEHAHNVECWLFAVTSCVLLGEYTTKEKWQHRLNLLFATNPVVGYALLPHALTDSGEQEMSSATQKHFERHIQQTVLPVLELAVSQNDDAQNADETIPMIISKLITIQQVAIFMTEVDLISELYQCVFKLHNRHSALSDVANQTLQTLADCHKSCQHLYLQY